jgi:hypothetical protein
LLLPNPTAIFDMPPKAIFANPTEHELAALPKASHSGLVVTIQRSWIYDHEKKLLRHGVKELHVEIDPLVGKGKAHIGARARVNTATSWLKYLLSTSE